MASFDISDLESRLRKLQDRDNVPSLDELEARLARLQDKPYVPSKKPSSEADKLIEQIKSEIKLENKSKELNDRPNQELRDRLTRLKEDRPKKPVVKNPKNLTFQQAKSIIADSLDRQAKIASRATKQVNEEETKIPLMDFTTKLYDMRDIIANTPDIPKEQEPKLLDIVANTLSKIYDGIKKITTPAINTLKKIGSIFTDSIKSLSKKSSDKQMAESKAQLKELYKSYVDLKGVDAKVKKEFLKNHYSQIDQLQTPQQIFLETAKVIRSIATAGAKKVQQHSQAINRLGNLHPSNTPNNRTKTSKNIQR
ncbi:hypothetical protein [Rickettsia endosymbiont of Nabis limbatus]|uniref:hypothetical protein n=1 Tax=Rickettsia endosymbiont of Nabis limbatus TaxID=3066268 RepID=UPI003AF34148